MDRLLENLKLLEEENANLAKLLGCCEQREKQWRKLREAVKAVGARDGTCWCGVRSTFSGKHERLFHAVKCDALYVAIYGGERE